MIGPDSRLMPLMERLRSLLEERGFRVLEIWREEASRKTGSADEVIRLRTELCRGPEISLKARFSLGPNRTGALDLNRTVEFRWPRAEEAIRDLKPAPPYSDEQLRSEGATDAMIRRMHEARAQLYPIALVATSDVSHAATPDAAMNSQLLAQAADSLVSDVVPRFSPYCDSQQLVSAALMPAKQSHLHLDAIRVAIILVFAGKRREFQAWCNGPRHTSKGPVATPFEQHYFSALIARLPQ
jgi:hypothetical protein